VTCRGLCTHRRNLAVSRCICYVFVGTLLSLFVLYLARAGSVRHIDDVHPLIPCPLIDELAAEGSPSVTLWMIPFHEGRGLSSFPQWLAHVNALRARGLVTFGMHGVNHSVHNEVEVEAGLADREVFEFECCVDNVTNHLARGITEWQRAFHEPPSRLAFPGGFATPEAVRIARGTFHLQLRTIFDGLFHRIYHCDDSFCPAPFLCTTDSLNSF